MELGERNSLKTVWITRSHPGETSIFDCWPTFPCHLCKKKRMPSTRQNQPLVGIQWLWPLPTGCLFLGPKISPSPKNCTEGAEFLHLSCCHDCINEILTKMAETALPAREAVTLEGASWGSLADSIDARVVCARHHFCKWTMRKCTMASCSWWIFCPRKGKESPSKRQGCQVISRRYGLIYLL